MRLFVEHRGKRRAFRLSSGVLSIGSGPEAKLRLDDPGVAALHAKLSVRGEAPGQDARATFTCEPGVEPPRVDGVPQQAGTFAMVPGRTLQLGQAFLWIEGEAAAADRGEDAAEDVGGEGVAGSRSVTPTRRSASARARRRQGASSSSGMPGWLVAMGAVLGVAAALLFVWRAFLFSADQAEPEAATRLGTVRAMLDQGRIDAALERLDGLDSETFTPQERALYDELRTSAEDIRAQAERAIQSREGSQLLAWLQQYEAEELAGAPSLAKVRLFLKRAARFRAEHPDHPALDWLDRQELRFEGVVDLDAPADWESVKWEARSLTRSMPRNYVAAFALLEEFQERVEEGSLDHDEVTRYLRLLEVDRDEHHENRMEFAQECFENGDDGRAVWWLVHQVIWSGNPDLADQAARVLIKMPRAEEHLRGYRDEQPDRYAALMENAIVGRFVRVAENRR